MKTIGETIKNKRNEYNISQRELARRIGVDNAYISRIEKENSEKPSINVLIKISKELNINFFELLEKTSYSNIELETLINTNINEVFKFVNQETIENYLIQDENNNIRLSLIKILNGFKNNKINEKETIGLLSCLINKNLYNYLTKNEIKNIKDIEKYIDKN